MKAGTSYRLADDCFGRRRENVKGRENGNGNCGRRIGDDVMRF
jgi:hypothetical protein